MPCLHRHANISSKLVILVFVLPMNYQPSLQAYTVVKCSESLYFLLQTFIFPTSNISRKDNIFDIQDLFTNYIHSYMIECCDKMLCMTIYTC